MEDGAIGASGACAVQDLVALAKKLEAVLVTTLPLLKEERPALGLPLKVGCVHVLMVSGVAGAHGANVIHNPVSLAHRGAELAITPNLLMADCLALGTLLKVNHVHVLQQRGLPGGPGANAVRVPVVLAKKSEVVHVTILHQRRVVLLVPELPPRVAHVHVLMVGGVLGARGVLAQQALAVLPSK